MAESTTDEFSFEAGDRVLVRVRENGTSGTIDAKFEAECSQIEGEDRMTSTRARFDLPWGLMNSVTLRPYDAEFEVIDDE